MDRSNERPTDLAGRVTAAAARRDRDGVRSALRVGLVVVALGELTFAVPDLLLGHGFAHPDHNHLVRHAAAFSIAYAIGLLFVAHRPARARAFVPLTVALAAAMVFGAFGDITTGGVAGVYWVQHVLEILGMVLIWILASRPLWARPDAASPNADVDGTTGAAVLRLPPRSDPSHQSRQSG